MDIRLNRLFLQGIQLGLIALCLSFIRYSHAIAPFQVQATGGAGVQPRIASGTPVNDLAQTSWMASIINQSGTQVCGAVLVDEHHLLTAAHCISQFVPNEFRVVFETNTANEQAFQVERAWIPETFRWSSLKNDIAVIRLQQEVVNRTPLHIADPIEFVGLSDGDTLTVMGFGQVTAQGGLSQVLREGQVPYVSPQTCAGAWSGEFPTLADMIQNEGVCASGMGGSIDTCLGDSGGPLLLYRDGWRLLGITSFGEATCGGAQKPSVYLKTSAFSTEIEKALLGESYYANWTQALVGDESEENQVTLQIKNRSNETWTFASLSESTLPFKVNPASNCENTTLSAGEFCQLIIEFQPESAGFYHHRYLLNRVDATPVWIDLQGFGFEYIPSERFGQETIFGFAGGEVAPEQVLVGGISSGGYLQLQQIQPLEYTELYIGVNASQPVTLYMDYIPSDTSDEVPIVEMRVLSRYDEEVNLNLDRREGWQSQTVQLAGQDYLYIRIQAKGRGMNGHLKLDFGGNDEYDFDPLDGNQSGQDSQMQPKEVALESGGSFGVGITLVLFLAACRQFFRKRM